MDTDFAPSLEQLIPQDSGWGLLTHVGDVARRNEARARAESLELFALAAAHAGDEPQACWYLARSLGAAAKMASDAGPRLLLELDLALADLPEAACDPLRREWRGNTDLPGVEQLRAQLAHARRLADEERFLTAPMPLLQ